MGMSPPASFGRPEPPPPPMPPLADIPVLSLGQVQAELQLTVNEESLRAAGSAIASMVADATVQGFAAGWEHATGEPFRAPTPAGPPTEDQR